MEFASLENLLLCFQLIGKQLKEKAAPEELSSTDINLLFYDPN